MGGPAVERAAGNDGRCWAEHRMDVERRAVAVVARCGSSNVACRPISGRGEMIAALVCAVAVVSGPLTDVAAAPAAGAFSVLAPSGTRVDGKELVARDRPLVVYLVPESQASTRALVALREWWQPGWDDRVVLVFGAAIGASRAWF